MKKDSSSDVVLRFLEIIADCVGGLEEQAARQIEDQIRQEFGGDEPYIARVRWTDLAERDAAIRAELAAGRTEREVCVRFCVGKGTIHRIKNAG